MRQLSWNQTSFFSFICSVISTGASVLKLGVLGEMIKLELSVSALGVNFFFGDFLVFFEPAFTIEASGSFMLCLESGFFLENHIGSGRT